MDAGELLAIGRVQRGTGLNPPARLYETAQQIPPCTEVFRHRARVRGRGCRIIPHQKSEHRSRVDRTNGVGAIQLGRQQLDHPFAEIGKAAVPADREGKHRDRGRQRR